MKTTETLSSSQRWSSARGSDISSVSIFSRQWRGNGSLKLSLFAVRFLDMYQVTQALNTVLTNPKQLMDMRRSWEKIDFDSVRNQSALVCNCRHEDLQQLLEGEFLGLLESLGKSPEPVRDVMAWADKCCERLMGRGPDERSTMSSRSVLIRWGYVTSQVMRDLVSGACSTRVVPCLTSLRRPSEATPLLAHSKYSNYSSSTYRNSIPQWRKLTIIVATGSPSTS